MDHPAYHRPGNPYGDSYGAFGDNQVTSVCPVCYLVEQEVAITFLFI